MNILQLHSRNYSPDLLSLVERILDARPKEGQYSFTPVDSSAVLDYYVSKGDGEAAVFTLVKFGAFLRKGEPIPGFSNLYRDNWSTNYDSFSAAFIISLLAVLAEIEGVGSIYSRGGPDNLQNFHMLIQFVLKEPKKVLKDCIEFTGSESLQEYASKWAAAVGITSDSLT